MSELCLMNGTSPLAGEKTNEISGNPQRVGQLEQKTNRVKTRFLNFRFAAKPEIDEPIANEACAADLSGHHNPLGQLAIVEGAGRGKRFALTHKTASRIGRGDNQEIQLAFGDNSISRTSHATIVYYGEHYGFLLRDGRKANPVFLNGRALSRDEYLSDGDLIRVGETTLQYTAFNSNKPA